MYVNFYWLMPIVFSNGDLRIMLFSLTTSMFYVASWVGGLNPPSQYCINVFSPPLLIHTPAISPLLSGFNGSAIVLPLPPQSFCHLYISHIFHYQQPPSESFRETAQSLNSLQVTTFADRMSRRTKLPGNTELKPFC